MTDLTIRKIWQISFDSFLDSGRFLSDVQRKASAAILNCKSGKLGVNVSICSECGHTEVHNNSYRNRSCPNYQAVNKEIFFWGG